MLMPTSGHPQISYGSKKILSLLNYLLRVHVEFGYVFKNMNCNFVWKTNSKTLRW